MDKHRTVFYLEPLNDSAFQIVDDDINTNWRRVDPNNVSRRFLRVGLDETARIPSRLVTFDRLPLAADIILREFPNTDQYYFDFYPITGELLLHDISKNDDTQLRKIKDSEEGAK